MNAIPLSVDEAEASIPDWSIPFILFGGALAGFAVSALVLPVVLPSLVGTEPKAFWFLSRSSAFVAYLALWLSVMLGLLASTKLSRTWPGAARTIQWHQDLSLVGLGAMIFHALILLGDNYIGFNLWQLLVPFGSKNYATVSVALGQIGLYVALLVGMSFYVRARIGPRNWRRLHYLSFAAVLLALAHGISSGTDTSTPLVSAMYWVTGAGLLFLTSARIVLHLWPATKVRRTA